jgi:gluconokinase
MGANMVKSQMGILEPPEKDETDMISVDVSGTPEEVKRDTWKGIELALQQ